MALLGGEFEEADALGLVCAGAREAEDPADGSRFHAEHVVLNALGEVCVVEVRVDDQDLFAIFAGELAELVGPSRPACRR